MEKQLSAEGKNKKEEQLKNKQKTQNNKNRKVSRLCRQTLNISDVCVVL